MCWGHERKKEENYNENYNLNTDIPSKIKGWVGELAGEGYKHLWVYLEAQEILISV